VILDSPIPLQADYLTHNPQHINESLQRLFDNCAASDECNADFPELEDTFYGIVETLDAEPITIGVTHPVTSQPFQMAVDGQRFIDTMRWSMYFADNIQFLPFIINSVAVGNLDFFQIFAEQLLTTPQYLSEIAHYSILCNEELPFTDRDAVAAYLDSARDEAEPYLSIETSIAFSVCDEWGLSGVENATHDPVESDIPTLIIAGEYDSIAPPTYAEMTAETLSSSFLYVFPGESHNIVFSLDVCPLRSVARFIEAPLSDPNLECFADMESTNFLSRADMLDLANSTQQQNNPDH
jgi:pimeloyl-ACP methyl ester carboxylesterase